VIPEKQRKAMLRELAQTAAGAEFTCNSGSMAPTIVVGESVRVRATPPHRLRVGDVVVYEGKDGIYMLHRIVLISPGRSWFLHLGDAPSTEGARRAPMSAIVGRTRHARRMPGTRVYLRTLRSALVRRTRRYAGL
jgi:signal peptidase I